MLKHCFLFGLALVAETLAAVDFQFSGVLGQSQASDSMPADFLVASDAMNAWNDGIYFRASGFLCRLERDGNVTKLLALPWVIVSMCFDGQDVYLNALDGYIHRVSRDGDTFRLEKLFAPGENNRIFAVAPAGLAKGFAAKYKYFIVDKEGRVFAWTKDFKPAGVVLRFPKVKGNSPCASLGVHPTGGELLLGSGYYDNTVYRYNPDGSPYGLDGWPVAGQARRLKNFRQELWALGGNARKVPDKLGGDGPVQVGTPGDNEPTGIGVDSAGYYLSSAQGLCYYDMREPKLPARRIGGLPGINALAAGNGAIMLTCSSDPNHMVALRFDDPRDAPLVGQGDERWRVGNAWEGKVVDLVAWRGSYLVLDNVKNGLWAFDPTMDGSERKYRWRQVKIVPALAAPRAIAASASTIWLLDGGKLYRGEIKGLELSMDEVKVPGAESFTRLRAVDENTVVAASDAKVTMLAYGKTRWTVSSPAVKDIAVTPYGVAVADADGLKLFGLQRGDLAASLESAALPGGGALSRLAASGKWLFAGDVKNRRLLRFKVK